MKDTCQLAVDIWQLGGIIDEEDAQAEIDEASERLNALQTAVDEAWPAVEMACQQCCNCRGEFVCSPHKALERLRPLANRP